MAVNFCFASWTAAGRKTFRFASNNFVISEQVLKFNKSPPTRFLNLAPGLPLAALRPKHHHHSYFMFSRILMRFLSASVTNGWIRNGKIFPISERVGWRMSGPGVALLVPQQDGKKNNGTQIRRQKKNFSTNFKHNFHAWPEKKVKKFFCAFLGKVAN